MAEFLQRAEPWLGSVLYALVLCDLLLTVLYARLGGKGIARLGAGFLSNAIGRSVRRALAEVGRRLGRRDAWLSFAGPLTVIALPFAWTWILTLSVALVIHSHLGTSVVVQQGVSGTDFVTALYAAGTSLAITGSSEYIPADRAMRLLYLSNALVGTSVMTLTLTYLMQVYPALLRRNALAMAVDAYTARTGDAARFVAALLPEGDSSLASSNLASLGETLVQVEEGYHFYPVLFYFRPSNPRYADIRFATIALDAATLMQTALSEALVRRVGHAAPVLLMHDAAFVLAKTLEGTFIDEDADKPAWPDPATEARWRDRFDRACRLLEASRVPLAGDRERAAHCYIEARSRWQPTLDTLGDYTLYEPGAIDPALWPARHS